jgi:hypothetical protein
MRSSRRSVTVLAATAGLLLGAVAALNLRADPHGQFPSTGDPALAGCRENGSRRAKAERLARERADVLVFGSSRAMASLDPRSPHWGGATVYNAALRGTNVLEMGRVFDHALDHGAPRRVVLAVDLLGFGDRRSFPDDFLESRFNPDRDAIGTLFGSLLGWGQAADSIGVLKESARPGRRPPVRPDGFLFLDDGRPPTWEAFTDVLRRNFFVDVSTYNGFRYSRERVETVGDMLLRCRREGIEADVLLLPVHALQLEAMRLMGVDGQFERLKRDLLVGTGIAAATPSTARPPALWDFTGYRDPCTEAVPLEGSRAMAWFRDASHATARLGEVVIARVSGREDAAAAAMPGFGVRLEPGTIEPHLASIRAARAAWARDHVEEVERLRRIHGETAAERARNLLIADGAQGVR